jgi:prephenate dehydrogenase
MQSMAAALDAAAIVTDVGSAKASVVTLAQRCLPNHIARFIPGHPIAGTENSGVEASFDGLFTDRRVILTPTEQTDVVALYKVSAMWKACGATVSEMSVEHHDSVLAATSHLPHMLAFTLVDYLAGRTDKEEIFDYAAGGFRDFTRIASSDPVMWRDICLSNSDAILGMVKEYQSALDSLSQALEASDGEHILELFQRAKASRDEFSG